MKRKSNKTLLVLALAGLLSSCNVEIVIDKESKASTPETSKSSEAASSLASNAGSSLASAGEQSSEYIPDSGVTVTYETKKFYVNSSLVTNGSRTAYYTGFDLETYFLSDDPGVPYVALSDMASLLTNSFGLNFTVNGSVMTSNGATATFNVATDTITITDWDRWSSFSNNMLGNLPMDVAAMNYDTAISGTPTGTYTAGSAMSFNLADYGADVFGYYEDVMIPFAYWNALLFVPNQMTFSYNGVSYFEADSVYLTYYAQNSGVAGQNPYGNVTAMSTHSSNYADYFYGSSCFLLDYCYGKSADINGTSKAQDLAVASGYDVKMKQSDAKSADAAFAEFLAKYYDDGGHTGFTSFGFGTSFSQSTYSEASTTWGNALSDSGRTNGTYAATYNLTYARRQSTATYYKAASNSSGSSSSGSDGVSVKDGVGILRFDSFNDDGTHNGSLADTYSLFQNAFTKFAASSVSKVVIDLSLNGGGHITSALQALSYLTPSGTGITVNVENPVTGSRTIEQGSYTATSHASDYAFYVLVSKATFSAANYFARYVKDHNLGKIIGQEASGGGDCAVGAFSLADGAMFQGSSLTKLENTSWGSIDNGASLDYTLPYASYYSDTLLSAFVNHH